MNTFVAILRSYDYATEHHQHHRAINYKIDQARPDGLQHYHDLGMFLSLPDSNETLCMLNRQRELTLPRPTAAPTATQLRVF